MCQLEHFGGSLRNHRAVKVTPPFCKEHTLNRRKAKLGRVDKAEKMSKKILECGASHGSSLG